jgi:hypothetical protein
LDGYDVEVVLLEREGWITGGQFVEYSVDSEVGDDEGVLFQNLEFGVDAGDAGGEFVPGFGARDAMAFPIGELGGGVEGKALLDFLPGEALPGTVVDLAEVCFDGDVAAGAGGGLAGAEERAGEDGAAPGRNRGDGFAEAEVERAKEDAGDDGFGVAHEEYFGHGEFGWPWRMDQRFVLERRDAGL